jgi:hypothetical protein
MNDCIERCYRCAEACEYCIKACLETPTLEEMHECLRLAAQCAALCRLSTRYIALNKEPGSLFCQICADACRACAAECDKHRLSACHYCAALCRQCAAVFDFISD